VIKRILGVGTGLAVMGVVGVLGYRHFVPAGPASADAATPPTTSATGSKVINLGAEVEAPVAPGRVKISPVTPRQMPPKMSDLKPKPAATQPTTQSAPGGFKTRAAVPVAPAAAAAQQQMIKPVKSSGAAGQLVQPKVSTPTTQPRAATTRPTTKPASKRKTISIQGDGQSSSAGASGAKLTPAERASFSLLHQLRILRNSIDVWKVRHEGEEIDFVANSGWEQLIRDPAGQLLGAPPVNPFNGCSRVLAVRDDPKPGQAVAGPFGYVYAAGSGKLYATDGNGRIVDDAAIDAVALEVRAVREMAPQDAERYLLVELGTMRTQLAAYAQHHADRMPDFARYPKFEQLLQRTLADGRVVEGAGPGRSGQMFGPYILSMPVNPLNGKYKVKALDGEVKVGQRVDWDEAGFVYSTAARRLYGLDANGCVFDESRSSTGNPSRESTGTSSAASADPVQTLRGKLAQYKAQHNDRLPDLKKYPRWEQLTSKTTADGVPDASGEYGPYLFQTPVNTSNGSTQVLIVSRVQSYRANPTVGFVFEVSSGRIWATDAQGNLVQD
jgi:hypothetical protein